MRKPRLNLSFSIEIAPGVRIGTTIGSDPRVGINFRPKRMKKGRKKVG